MHGIIVDIDRAAIQAAEESLADLAAGGGVEVVGFAVDVSSVDEVQELRSALADRFPSLPVSLVCCNAGVGAGGDVIGARDIDWDFVLGVNVKGVANFVRIFVPGMVEQESSGALVATSSQDGVCAAQGVYGVSKHACVALMEALYQEVRGGISVHVLCPNVVATNIVQSGTHRPERFGGPTPSNEMVERMVANFKAHGMPPEQCADYVFDALSTGTFYILAEADEDPGHIHNQAKVRMDAMLGDGKPFRPHSEFIARVFRGRG